MILAQNRQDSICFTLQTQHTTYQMLADTHRVLLHTYYGFRIDDSDMSALVRYADRGFSPNPHDLGMDKTYSLDTLPQEYSSCGMGDYRLPSIELELPDGSAFAEPRYVGYEIQKGKYMLPDLPAFYAQENQAETLIIYLEDAASQVQIALYYGVFEERDLITRAVRVTNQGKQTVKLQRAASLCLDFPAGNLDSITFNGKHLMERCPNRGPVRPGVQSVGSIRGTSSHQHNPFIVLCEPEADEDTGLCIGAMLLYSGNFEVAVEHSQFEDTRLIMGIHPWHFCWDLTPGESFTTPEVALVCANGLTAMSQKLHKAIRRHLIRNPKGMTRKPVLVNNWEATYFNFTADKLVEIAKAAAPLGIELFVMDDGWFGDRNDEDRSLGDWVVNQEKLPGGLEALAPRIRELGMQFGFWIEPEMVNENSQLYREHPDWVLGTLNRGKSRGRKQFVLDFTRKDVRDYIYANIRQFIIRSGAVYIKWDMNRSLSEVWSAALPAQKQGEVFHRYVLGVYEMLEQFRQDFPELLIEGCSGGGGRFDGGMLYYTPQIWCSDNTDAIDRLRIQYGTSFCYPVSTMGAHVSAVPNDQTWRTVPLAARGVTAMSGAFGYELDITRLNIAQHEEISWQIAFYKEHYHLIHEGDYYRLSDPFQNHACNAWEQVSEDKTEALVSLVTGTIRAGAPFRRLRLKGLNPDWRYQINGEEIYAGDLLMNAGYPLPNLMDDYQSLQLYLARV